MESREDEHLLSDMLEAVELGFITEKEALEFCVYVRMMELRINNVRVKLEVDTNK